MRLALGIGLRIGRVRARVSMVTRDARVGERTGVITSGLLGGGVVLSGAQAARGVQQCEQLLTRVRVSDRGLRLRLATVRAERS